MLIAKLGRDNTIILVKDEVELPSDIDGVFVIHFKEHIKETLPILVKRLNSLGFETNSDTVIEILNN